jgi:hypothetical protein
MLVYIQIDLTNVNKVATTYMILSEFDYKSATIRIEMA